MQRARQRKGGDRQDGLESWRSSHGIVQSAGLPGLCRRQAPGTAATSVLTQRRKRPSLLPFPASCSCGYTRLLGYRTPFQPRQPSRRLGLSHALVKEQRRRREEGGFTPCSSLASLPGHRAPRPPFQLSWKKDTPEGPLPWASALGESSQTEWLQTDAPFSPRLFGHCLLFSPAQPAEAAARGS